MVNNVTFVGFRGAIVQSPRLPLDPPTRTQDVRNSVTSPKFWRGQKIWEDQNVWFYAYNTILFGIPPVKAQNDYMC